MPTHQHPRLSTRLGRCRSVLIPILLVLLHSLRPLLLLHFTPTVGSATFLSRLHLISAALQVLEGSNHYRDLLHCAAVRFQQLNLLAVRMPVQWMCAD